MGMNRQEKFTKQVVMRNLSREGYPTYAKLLNEFDLNLTSVPSIVGFMEPAKGRIVLNRYLDEDQVSVIIRHEILHFYLKHELRLLKKLAQDTGVDFDTLDDLSIDDLKKDLYKNDNFNIAADYEISNRGYTEKDKENVRAINLNGQLLSGLVTEDDHPDWIDLSVEEMYDLVNDLREKDQKQQKPQKPQKPDKTQQQGDKDDQGEQGGSNDQGDSQPGEQGNQGGQSTEGGENPGSDSGENQGKGQGENSSSDSAGEEGQSQEGEQSSQSGKGKGKNGKSKSNKTSTEGNDEGGEGEGSNQGTKPVIHYGDFYNSNTFLDSSGIPYDLIKSN